MKWGENDSSARRTLWVAIALLVVVCACILSGMFDDAQARVGDQGNRCLRTGPSGGTDGSVALWWSEDGKRQEVGE